jgi:hypothetical protein
MAFLPLAVVVYLVLALWLAHTKAPWCDEGWFANPAYNLAISWEHGQQHFGTERILPQRLF